MLSGAGGGYSRSNKLISHCKFDGVIVCIDVVSCSNWVIEYCKLLNTINDHNSSSQHCDNIYVWDCNGLILRYNYVNCEYSQAIDRKSTRLNSSHANISYA